MDVGQVFCPRLWCYAHLGSAEHGHVKLKEREWGGGEHGMTDKVECVTGD